MGANVAIPNKTTKSDFLIGLHFIFIQPIGEMTAIAELMTEYMSEYNVRFLDALDVAGSEYWDEDTEEHFFEVVNSKVYNDLKHFCILCEDYMDLSDIGTVDELAARDIAREDANRSWGKLRWPFNPQPLNIFP